MKERESTIKSKGKRKIIKIPDEAEHGGWTKEKKKKKKPGFQKCRIK